MIICWVLGLILIGIAFNIIFLLFANLSHDEIAILIVAFTPFMLLFTILKESVKKNKNKQ